MVKVESRNVLGTEFVSVRRKRRPTARPRIRWHRPRLQRLPGPAERAATARGQRMHLPAVSRIGAACFLEVRAKTPWCRLQTLDPGLHRGRTPGGSHSRSPGLTYQAIHATRPAGGSIGKRSLSGSIMHDIRKIAQDPDGFDRSLARRGIEQAAAHILDVDGERRRAITEAERLRAERKATSRSAGQAQVAGDDAAFERHRDDASALRARIMDLEGKIRDCDRHLREILLEIPNLPHDDVPDGCDENDNVEIRRWGVPPEFEFSPKEHFEIDASHGSMDFELAARIAGSRFVVLTGAIARLHRALGQFMLDWNTTRNGYLEANPPVLVRDETMIGTGQLPKFAGESYRTTDGHWLIPTSEVSLTNFVADTILPEDELPQRYTAHTLCFRSEAGAAGRDTAGMLRQHQFEKVEMVSVTRPEDSRAELDRMTGCAEGILKALELPFRTVVLCTGDMGFGACRTHDIEVWLPGQDAYREISSCSVCDEFQARRMNARFRRTGGGKPEYVHTLNGSGLAIGRCLIAVLENGQRSDGSVLLPAALRPWLGGFSKLTAEGEFGG